MLKPLNFSDCNTQRGGVGRSVEVFCANCGTDHSSLITVSTHDCRDLSRV